MRQIFNRNQGQSPERERLDFFEVQTYRIAHLNITFTMIYRRNLKNRCYGKKVFYFFVLVKY